MRTFNSESKLTDYYGSQKNMTKVFTDVSVFLKAVGQSTPPFIADEGDQSRLYKTLIDEEYAEFIEAWNANDEVEKIDACFDMMWVIVG
jgi:hypothetical protein